MELIASTLRLLCRSKSELATSPLLKAQVCYVKSGAWQSSSSGSLLREEATTLRTGCETSALVVKVNPILGAQGPGDKEAGVSTHLRRAAEFPWVINSS